MSMGLGGCVSGDEPPAFQAPKTLRNALAFTDVTTEAGLGGFRHETGAFGQKWMPETLGAGGGFIDYDGDGWLDVLLVGGGTWRSQRQLRIPALRLYRNLGNGTFTDVTEATGLNTVHTYGFGVTAADYDNDGDVDVFLTTLAQNVMLRNDGGRFTDVSRTAGLADQAAWSTAALFFDADRDGWLDLYVGNYVDWSPEEDLFCTSDGTTKAYCTPHQYEGVPGRFYHNNGDGTFSDWTRRTRMDAGAGKTLGAAEFDADRDGWPDLVVANDTERNLLFRNRGDGTFEEVGVPSGVAYDANGRARAGMGIDVGVVDASGQPTIFVGNFSDEMVGVFQRRASGLFVDRGPASGIGVASLPTLTFGLLLFDADLDADLDLLLANGHIIEDIGEIQAHISYRQPQLFLNDGNGIFTLASDVFTEALVARGAAYGDYDRDGDLDVLLTENGGPAHLLRNELLSPGYAPAHYLRVRLDGPDGRRNGMGARVEAIVGGRKQERWVRTGGTYLSQSETVVTFGLGTATSVDTLRVVWPGGHEAVMTAVPADQEVHPVEGRQTADLQATPELLLDEINR